MKRLPTFRPRRRKDRIRFHEWLGGSWGVLFSHPKDFTPVCTTELGYMARLKPEFDKRNTKIIGLSVDPVDKHQRWSDDIEETQGLAPNYPMIGDTDLVDRRSYTACCRPRPPGSSEGRTAADNQTVRNVFVIGPDKKIKLIIVYPMTTGRNFDEVLRVIDSLQLTANHKVATPVNWKPGDDVIIAGSVSDEDAKKTYPNGWNAPQPVHPHRAATDDGITRVRRASERSAPAQRRARERVGESEGRRPSDKRERSMKTRVVVLGAGFGGLELTTILSDAFGDAIDIVLIDKGDAFVFGFSKLDVMFGRQLPAAVRHPYRDIVKPGVRFVQTTVRSIDPAARRTVTDAGTFDADVLVVALGADYDLAATPGLVEGGHEFYTVAGAFALRDVAPALRARTGDRRRLREVVQVSAGAERDALCCCTITSRHAADGTRRRSRVVMPFGTPIPPSPDTSQAILAAFAERGITFVKDQLVKALDPGTQGGRAERRDRAAVCALSRHPGASRAAGRRRVGAGGASARLGAGEQADARNEVSAVSTRWAT